jgi:hypothetical protein
MKQATLRRLGALEQQSLPPAPLVWIQYFDEEGHFMPCVTPPAPEGWEQAPEHLRHQLCVQFVDAEEKEA